MAIGDQGVALEGISSEADARIFCMGHAAGLSLSADADVAVVLRAALYVLIEDGLILIPGATGVKIYPGYVYVDTFKDKLTRRCGAQLAFRSSFGGSPQAVLDQLQRLDLLYLTEDLVNMSSLCTLKLEQLLQGAAAAAAAGDGDLASDEEDTEWSEGMTQDEGDDEEEELEGTADEAGRQPWADAEPPEAAVAFFMRKKKRLKDLGHARQRFVCAFGTFSCVSSSARHKKMATAGLRAAVDLALQQGAHGRWVMRPVPLRTVFDQAKKETVKQKLLIQASADFQEFRSVMWGAPSAQQIVKIFCEGDRECLMINVGRVLGKSIRALGPAPDAAPQPQPAAANKKTPAPPQAAPAANGTADTATPQPQKQPPKAPAAVPPPVRSPQPDIPTNANGDFVLGASLADTPPLVRQAVRDLQGHSDLGLVGVPSEPARPERPTTAVLALALAAPTGQAWVVHFGALRPGEAREAWALLAPLLRDPGAVKVAHDARWLGPAVRRACGAAIAPLWDTQVASGVAQFLAGVGGAAAKTMQPCLSLEALFDAYGVCGAPELAASRPFASSWHRAKLPDGNVAFLAAHSVHLLRLADKLNGDLGAAGVAAVLRMSRAYAECLLPEGDRGYAPSGAAAKSGAAALPRGMPLEVFFEEIQGAGRCKAVYRVGPEDEARLAGAVPPAESGGRVWAPRAPSAAGTEDPAQNADLQSMLRLFPGDVAAAIVAVCRGEPAPAAAAAPAAASDGREKPPPPSPSRKRRFGANWQSQGGGARAFLWPIEIVLDVGRPMAVRLSDGSEEELPGAVQIGVDAALRALEGVKEALGLPAGAASIFSSDNRAGVPGTLHRLSAMRGRQGEVLGLTYRVGRHLEGVGQLLRDVLSRLTAPAAAVPPSAAAAMGLPGGASIAVSEDGSSPSLLLLGPPGVGKTTLLRDVSRLLADDFRRRVVIVDTSAEIAGDGAVPHRCIGRARRMWVPHRDRQHEVMREAVQNHTPDVIVIDEISDPREVAAARTIAQRGVVLVGTAHGTSLETLIKNPELNALVGGVTAVTVGDAAARPGPDGTVTKTKLERRGAPCFTTAIELLGPSQWRIHWDVAASVDALLAGRRPETQLRWAAPDGRLMATVEGGGGAPRPGEAGALRAAHLASKALKGDPRAAAEWVADLSLLTARYADE